MSLQGCQQAGDIYKKHDKNAKCNKNTNAGDDLTEIKQFSVSDSFYNLYVTKSDSAPIL
jgi:hypothetical protein